MNDPIQIGTIMEVDGGNRALVRVQVFDRVSDWIPYIMTNNSNVKIWMPPQLGEQVMVLSLYGEDGVAVGSVYNSDCKEPTGANATTSVMEFSDGTVIKYDTSSKMLSILGSGAISVSAQNGINITANVNIEGNLTVSGTVTDEKGSLTTHTHSGVTEGNAVTGARP